MHSFMQDMATPAVAEDPVSRQIAFGGFSTISRDDQISRLESRQLMGEYGTSDLSMLVKSIEHKPEIKENGLSSLVPTDFNGALEENTSPVQVQSDLDILQQKISNLEMKLNKVDNPRTRERQERDKENIRSGSVLTIETMEGRPLS